VPPEDEEGLAMNARTMALAGIVVALQGSGVGTARADVKSGEEIFRTKCANCHSLTPGLSTIAPDLRGVVGRKAGSLKGFTYSAALQNADFVWTPEKLEQWLQSPHQVAAETEMPFKGLKNEKKRAAVIEYLKSFK
jgi:cytochrome c